MLLKPTSNWHKATVLVCANGKVFGSKVLDVFVDLRGDVVEIIIEDLHTVYKDCANRFNNENSSFCLISKTLQIKSKNSIECPITVELTRE